MLGVRREGITETAGNLQRAGVISYRRGHIIVLDRSGLASRVCECYAVVKNEFDRLLCDVRNRQELPSASRIGKIFTQTLGTHQPPKAHCLLDSQDAFAHRSAHYRNRPARLRGRDSGARGDWLS